MTSEIKRNPDTGDFTVVNPAPFRALRGMLWNGQWYEWVETDPNAPMVPPEFRDEHTNPETNE